MPPLVDVDETTEEEGGAGSASNNSQGQRRDSSKILSGQEMKDATQMSQEDGVDEAKLLPRLSALLELDSLWETLSQCLLELGHTPDHHAVLVLQVCIIR